MDDSANLASSSMSVSELPPLPASTAMAEQQDTGSITENSAIEIISPDVVKDSVVEHSIPAIQANGPAIHTSAVSEGGCEAQERTILPIIDNSSPAPGKSFQVQAQIIQNVSNRMQVQDEALQCNVMDDELDIQNAELDAKSKEVMEEHGNACLHERAHSNIMNDQMSGLQTCHNTTIMAKDERIAKERSDEPQQYESQIKQIRKELSDQSQQHEAEVTRIKKEFSDQHQQHQSRLSEIERECDEERKEHALRLEELKAKLAAEEEKTKTLQASIDELPQNSAMTPTLTPGPIANGAVPPKRRRGHRGRGGKGKKGGSGLSKENDNDDLEEPNESGVADQPIYEPSTSDIAKPDAAEDSDTSAVSSTATLFEPTPLEDTSAVLSEHSQAIQGNTESSEHNICHDLGQPVGIPIDEQLVEISTSGVANAEDLPQTEVSNTSAAIPIEAPELEITSDVTSEQVGPQATQSDAVNSETVDPQHTLVNADSSAAPPTTSPTKQVDAQQPEIAVSLPSGFVIPLNAVAWEFDMVVPTPRPQPQPRHDQTQSSFDRLSGFLFLIITIVSWAFLLGSHLSSFSFTTPPYPAQYNKSDAGAYFTMKRDVFVPTPPSPAQYNESDAGAYFTMKQDAFVPTPTLQLLPYTTGNALLETTEPFLGTVCAYTPRSQLEFLLFPTCAEDSRSVSLFSELSLSLHVMADQISEHVVTAAIFVQTQAGALALQIHDLAVSAHAALLDSLPPQLKDKRWRCLPLFQWLGFAAECDDAGFTSSGIPPFEGGASY